MMLGHMGGRVDVASEPGRGSRFTVRLRHAPQVMTSTKAIAH